MARRFTPSGRRRGYPLAVCGRFTLSKSASEIAAHFDLPDVPALARRYNVAPGQDVAVVAFDPAEDARRLELRRWGLVPGWAKTPGDGARRINARVETVQTKPAFRDALRRRRGLVPADGFYEWKEAPGGKLPHHLALPGGALFAMAAVVEHWEDAEGRSVDSVAVLTTEAVEPIREIHGRMPVILAPGDYAAWLDPATDPAEALALCRPGPARTLQAKPVGKRVNDVRNDDPECLELEPLPLFD